MSDVYNQMNNNLFSIIIPTYNRAHIVARAIQSVLNQTYQTFEVIVVDDGSTDNTYDVIQSINDERLHYYSQQNQGRSAARNTGVAKACGQYITFLDSDDEALPIWLDHFVHALQIPRTGVVSVGCEIQEHGQKRVVLPESLGVLFDNQEGLFLAGTFAVRRDLFVSIGGYAEHLSFSENTELALRLVPYCLQTNWRIGTIAKPLLLYHYDRELSSSRSFQIRLDSAAYILQKYESKLKEIPTQYGIYCGLAGVNAARMRKFAQARIFFRAAIKAEPLNYRHYVRMLLALIPPIGHRFWLRYDHVKQ